MQPRPHDPISARWRSTHRPATPQAAALDWFNYGQFLRGQNAPEELAYASLLHAEHLLNGATGSELATVQAARHQVENKMGAKAAGVAQNNQPAELERAAGFMPASR